MYPEFIIVKRLYLYGVRQMEGKPVSVKRGKFDFGFYCVHSAIIHHFRRKYKGAMLLPGEQDRAVVYPPQGTTAWVGLSRLSKATHSCLPGRGIA